MSVVDLTMNLIIRIAIGKSPFNYKEVNLLCINLPNDT